MPIDRESKSDIPFREFRSLVNCDGIGCREVFSDGSIVDEYGNSFYCSNKCLYSGESPGDTIIPQPVMIKYAKDVQS